jgi:hypothetical protein
MPKAHRRRLAAYFTPPHLAHHAINAMEEAGIRPGQHRILDPASGGAAFLVPLAARIAESGHKRGARAKTILQDIERTLHGIEIEPGLAGLSQALLADLLRGEIESSGVDLKGLVQRANTLKLERPDTLYDAVIGNPTLWTHLAAVRRHAEALPSRHCKWLCKPLRPFRRAGAAMGSPRRRHLPHHSYVIGRRAVFCGTSQAHLAVCVGAAARPHRQAQRCFSRRALRPLRDRAATHWRPRSPLGA